MLELQLEQLGFGKNETKVYLGLFNLGKTKAGKIIESTMLHRNLVYTALESLLKKRLITKVVNRGVAIYQANSPDLIRDNLDEKREIAGEVIAELKKKHHSPSLDIKIFEGIDGVIESRKPCLKLKRGEFSYAFGGPKTIYEAEVSKRWKPFRTLRDKKGVGLKMLCDRTIPEEYIERKNGQMNTQVKRLPVDVELPAIFEMHGDVTNIIIPRKEPLVFSLKSQETTDSLINYFNFFWNQDSYVQKGAAALQKIWLEAIDCGGVRQIGARGYFFDRYPNLVKPIIEKMQATPGAYWKFVCEPSVRGHAITKFPWSQTKYTLSLSKNYNVVWLWGRKVAIVNWAENEPIIFISENKHVVQSNSDYFEELWNKK